MNAMSMELKGIFMTAKLLKEGCLRGSTKPTSDSRNGAHLSITFLIGSSLVSFQFFLEGHEALSKMFLEHHLTCNSNFFPGAKNAVSAPSLIAFGQVSFQNSYPLAELLYLFTNTWKTADVSIQFFVFVERLNRYSPPHTGANNLPRQNACFRSNHRASLDKNVIAKTHLAPDDAI